MADLQQVLKRFKRAPTDVVGVDVGASGIKVAHLQKSGHEVTLLGADVLPRPSLPEAGTAPPPPLNLSGRLKARYASIALSSPACLVRLINVTGAFEEGKLLESIGLDKPDNYRISYRVMHETKGETSVLAVAMPAAEAAFALALFPGGLPAPFSLEVSGLASISAFLYGDGQEQGEDAVAVMDFGAQTSTFALFSRRTLCLLRTFTLGAADLVQKVQQNLGVDGDTAMGIIADGAFDISQAVNELLEPLTKQLIVARHYVEQRWHCRVARLHVGGGIALSRDCLETLRAATDLEVQEWDPLKGLVIAPGALPDHLGGRHWRLGAAVGAALATFEETA